MGFFKNLFSKEKPDLSRTPASPEYTSDWGAFLTTIDNNEVGSIMTDLGLRPVVPIPEFETRVMVELIMLDPGPAGMSSATEIDLLNEIDEKLEAVLKQNHDAIYAGRLNHGGKLTSFSYVKEATNANETVVSVMSAYPQYQYKVETKHDPGWEMYLEFLYPEPVQMQTIQNGKVIQNLIENGDSLVSKRRVDHWAYFPDEEKRNRFLGFVKSKGFAVEGARHTPDNTNPYSLQFYRDDKVDQESVDEYTVELWQFANDIGGDYDGWETLVIRDK